MFLIDAHLDLAMNALEWNRDLRLPVNKINEREEGLSDKPDRGKATVSLPELRKGGVALVVATQIGRYVAPGNPLSGWHSPEQAWAQTQGQLAWYKAMEAAGEMRMITDLVTLDAHLLEWTQTTATESLPVGYILSLEGADSLIDVSYLEKAWQYGLRAVGPAHYGPGRYAPGTDATGPLEKDGPALLREMERLNMILDATHLCDESFWEALSIFHGSIWASHNNCRALVDHNRQYSDEQIKALIEKNAVIGGALDAWMMVPGWERGKSTPQAMNCNIDSMIDHIVHICSIAGNSLHVGIGSDLDGAFGREQCPYDLETIADLNKLAGLLSKRNFTETDIDNILRGNWLRFLRETWASPQT
ncbi:dipeptidase [Flavihumibacter petaseus]|uniref:Peptidase M19 family protein n=1 Tax=Flavihumibacter petaseus NBRC 106054 TaxID=1220578 RepID=A0A0E9N8A9_9BACT|nr:membrane dipeptidase [Flavihumibacter petaseus]GAO45620.1 peptidase M19 family protein [Flavihumibacter petaseus NBRC 106054]